MVCITCRNKILLLHQLFKDRTVFSWMICHFWFFFSYRDEREIKYTLCKLTGFIHWTGCIKQPFSKPILILLFLFLCWRKILDFMHGTSLNRSSLLFDYIFRVDFYNFKIKKRHRRVSWDSNHTPRRTTFAAAYDSINDPNRQRDAWILAFWQAWSMHLAWLVPCELLGGILLRGVTYKYNKVLYIFFIIIVGF